MPSTRYPHGGPPTRGAEIDVADIGYAVLLIGGFAVLALMLRGMEKL
ncbi:hypothetical protein [Amycolatopsis antarctica]|nr:hypothetical protein [Amycolatopsis antarctica]